ncbi:uncharacterized protein LOC142644308 [Castanea sativa]|uniref:uncharacterized protein LOC142644308 n=1 Tax=Castanea sativa TaxID=21020 RepID=UPI003F64CA0B
MLEREFEKEIEALKEAEGNKTPGQCVFERFLNATFLCLIPKKINAINIKDFRPISLVGNLCKLLAKVLAHRLQGVLDKLIFDSQNSFVEGRQAYDHVNWNALFYLMEMMGFGARWSRWIKFLWSSLRGSFVSAFISYGYGSVEEQLLYVRMVLIFFEAITGLKVNVGKSEIVPVGDVGNLNSLARTSCYKVGTLPMNIWEAHYKDSSIWDPIIE